MWVYCQGGMACSQVADGEDGTHVCRVGVNILNKLEKCGRSGWGLKIEPKTPQRKKQTCYKILQTALRIELMLRNVS
jgi:hypothetical protein